jgi:hypothetical protein
MEKWGADAYFISNGPGDPSAMPYAIEMVKEILEARQTFIRHLSWPPTACTSKRHWYHENVQWSQGAEPPGKNIIKTIANHFSEPWFWCGT